MLKKDFSPLNMLPKKETISNLPYIQNIRFEFLREFMAFIQKFGVIGLAVGVVIGQAVNQVVNSLVTNIITPLISIILSFALQGQQLKDFKPWDIGIGPFIDDLLKFSLTIFVVYLIVHYILIFLLSEDEKEKLNVRRKKQEQAEAKS